MMHETKSNGHKIMRRILAGAGLTMVGAIAVTWAWNTVVVDLTGLSRFRFAEGLSIAVLLFTMGALFNAGGRLVGGDHSGSSQ